MVKTLNRDGSPLLSSAAPFERLNQVLGRASNTFTTRATINMSTRFLGLQQAAFLCNKAVKKTKSPVAYPSTMQSELELSMEKDDGLCEAVDLETLSSEEAKYIDTQQVKIRTMRLCCYGKY
ncbi:hypothetical protein B9Z55_008479 [Caenorhabditis nigoni]|nr:hypothetical protein B9Z55_008479 [Caenorhabditis nigoni]